MKKILTNVIIVFIAILIIILTISIIDYNYPQFYNAYMSVNIACHPILQQQALEQGLIGGSFSVTGNVTKITIYDNSTRTNVHELCHQEQYNSGRLYTCANPVQKYFNELECYFKS